MKEILFKKVKGYTLTEILVVLLIIGILILLVLPNLLPLISKAKSTEAKMQLQHVQTLQKNYFYEKSKYTSDIQEIGFIQEKLVSDGEDGKANYKIEIIEADNKGFLARATSVVDFDGDGVFNVWEIDQDKNLKEVTAD
ncbi:prepilin-type N-terminal cleavage/methylation domain-containing protein [Sphingobacterium mizutaii]|uniref:prepilin-type N-terminal cleavage/methylation domain-containing protein n=1 Tax=Sphingobacterium mizutaii TaxID=1010 RepID=UPI001629D356|nr:prepilin-type N-terminal cleavage/methylation domain-containing protein [Sphingobacterium mizutaii]